MRGGLNPASHVEGDQSAYVGTENVARDYANPKVGGYENGYVQFDMKPQFASEFGQDRFSPTSLLPARPDLSGRFH